MFVIIVLYAILIALFLSHMLDILLIHSFLPIPMPITLVNDFNIHMNLSPNTLSSQSSLLSSNDPSLSPLQHSQRPTVGFVIISNLNTHHNIGTL